MARFGFRKENRLLSAREFDRVFKQAAYRIHAAEFLILAIENGESTSRLGTVVSKKIAGNSVERNRMRRLLKESFRLECDETGLDIVVVARPPAKAKENSSISQVLTGMWQKLASRRLRTS